MSTKYTSVDIALRRSGNPLLHPPPAGQCPIARLPDELWLEVLQYLEWEEVLAIRPVSRRVAALALSPPLHRSLTLFHLPLSPLPPVLRERVLPLVRHLALHFAPSPPEWHRRPGRGPHSANSGAHPGTALLSLLQAIPADRLLSLSIPCSSTFMAWDQLAPELKRIGGTLERLNFRRAGLGGHAWAEWMRCIGVNGRGLRELDLGTNAITTLPSDMPWSHLEHLSLHSCYLLPKDKLASFLAALPPSLHTLDLTGLQQLSLDALYAMRVTMDEERTPLSTVKLVGIDHLTRADVRDLERHWEVQRRGSSESCAPPYPIPSTYTFSSPTSAYTPSLGSSLGSSLRSTSSLGLSPGMPQTPGSPDADTDTLYTPPPSPPLSPTPGSSDTTWRFAAMGAAVATPSPIKQLRPTFGFNTRTPPAAATAAAAAGPAVFGGQVGLGLDLLAPLTPPPAPAAAAGKVTIVHSALLESDDEAGYRQFIGEVVDGTLGWDWGQL